MYYFIEILRGINGIEEEKLPTLPVEYKTTKPRSGNYAFTFSVRIKRAKYLK